MRAARHAEHRVRSAAVVHCLILIAGDEKERRCDHPKSIRIPRRQGTAAGRRNRHHRPQSLDDDRIAQCPAARERQHQAPGHQLDRAAFEDRERHPRRSTRRSRPWNSRPAPCGRGPPGCPRRAVLCSVCGHKGDVQGAAQYGLRESGSIGDRRIVMVNGGHNVAFRCEILGQPCHCCGIVAVAMGHDHQRQVHPSMTARRARQCRGSKNSSAPPAAPTAIARYTPQERRWAAAWPDKTHPRSRRDPPMELCPWRHRRPVHRPGHAAPGARYGPPPRTSRDAQVPAHRRRSGWAARRHKPARRSQGPSPEIRFLACKHL